MLDLSPGDHGWDVFSLHYHVDGPISTVSGRGILVMYFHFMSIPLPLHTQYSIYLVSLSVHLPYSIFHSPYSSLYIPFPCPIPHVSFFHTPFLIFYPPFSIPSPGVHFRDDAQVSQSVQLALAGQAYGALSGQHVARPNVTPQDSPDHSR